MKQITFKQIAIIICLFCAAMIFLTATAFSQDTIPTKRVKMVDHVGMSRKTGKIIRTSHAHWVNVKSGYIIKLSSGMYLINGREVYPNNFKIEKNYRCSTSKAFAK